MFKSPQQRMAYFEALRNSGKTGLGANPLGATPVQHNAAIAASPLLPSIMPPKQAQPMMQSPVMHANVAPNPMQPLNPAGANRFGKIKKII